MVSHQSHFTDGLSRFLKSDNHYDLTLHHPLSSSLELVYLVEEMDTWCNMSALLALSSSTVIRTYKSLPCFSPGDWSSLLSPPVFKSALSESTANHPDVCPLWCEGLGPGAVAQPQLSLSSEACVALFIISSGKREINLSARKTKLP